MATNQKLTSLMKGRVVASVAQTDTELSIQFQDGSTIHIKLAEPTSSVLVRDGQNKMEYAD